MYLLCAVRACCDGDSWPQFLIMSHLRTKLPDDNPASLNLIHSTEVEINEFLLFHFNKNLQGYGYMEPNLPSQIFARKQKVFSAPVNDPAQAIASFLAFEEKKFKTEHR